MNKTLKIKVCGITQIAQVHELSDLGIDYAGFIFYSQSPRYVKGKIAPQNLKAIGTIKKVGVFVNETYDFILKTIDTYGLDAVQLHGNEPVELCRRLTEQLPVIKAIGVKDAESTKQLVPYQGATTMFLLDTQAKEYGGTGQKFNWSLLGGVSVDTPVFLSGGIAPGDEPDIRRFISDHPLLSILGVDINSRFETQPGVKDMASIQTFIEGLNP